MWWIAGITAYVSALWAALSLARAAATSERIHQEQQEPDGRCWCPRCTLEERSERSRRSA